MAIRWISSAWRASLAQFPQDHRFYIDFRQQVYPEQAGSPTFTLITSADNQPGSHNFTGGYANYLLDLPSTLTLDIYFLPTFSYTGGANQYLWSWYNDATHYLAFYFDVATHKYTLAWKDGGTERTMLSSAYANDVTFQVWTRASFSLDLTTGTAAGSEFYLQGAAAETAWSGNTDVKARYFPVFTIRGQNGSAGSYTINYCRLFCGVLSTATEVAANFWNIYTAPKKDEEIVWHFNGVAMGHTRCNVTARTREYQLSRSVESAAGNASPNGATVVLMSPLGQFADDQYDDIGGFDPANEVYNGTSAQKYMQTHCPVEIETWYGGLFELEFSGHVDDNLFQRLSVIDDVSVVTISALDTAEFLQKAIAPVGYSYENYDLSKPSGETTSLIHTITRLNTKKAVTNYLGNSSFENATIGHSWLVAGAGATFSQVLGGLIGSNQGDLVYGAAAASFYQTVTFIADKKLNVGQNWNFSIYLKSAALCSGTLKLSGYTGAVETESTSANWSLGGGEGWREFEVTYTVATSTVNRLRCTVTLDTNVTLSADCAMLVQGKLSRNWFVLNTTDGAAGVISADLAVSASYNTVGFDVDDAAITHPWAVVKQYDTIWPHLSDIKDATAAHYLGIDPCGTMKYRTPFKAGSTNLPNLFTITAGSEFATIIDITQANHITIHGTKIVKEAYKKVIWNAKNANAFATIDGADIFEIVDSGGTFPDSTTFPEFWAKYSENN